MTDSRSRDTSSAPTTGAGGRRVLVLPPADADTRLAFDRALQLAAPGGAIVIFDRSHESWRPDDETGLCDGTTSTFDDLAGIDEARAGVKAGEAELLVWRSVSPAIGTAILDALQHTDATDIVLPDEGHTAASSDVVLGDEASLASAVQSVLAKPLSKDAGVTPELHLTPPAEPE